VASKKRSSIVGVPLYVGVTVVLLAALIFAYTKLAKTAGEQIIDLTPEAKAYTIPGTRKPEASRALAVT